MILIYQKTACITGGLLGNNANQLRLHYEGVIGAVFIL